MSLISITNAMDERKQKAIQDLKSDIAKIEAQIDRLSPHEKAMMFWHSDSTHLMSKGEYLYEMLFDLKARLRAEEEST